MENEGYDEEWGLQWGMRVMTRNIVHYLYLSTSRKSRVASAWLSCQQAYFGYENIVITVAGLLLHHIHREVVVGPG